MQIFLLKPEQYSKTLGDLVIFLSQVAHCYSEELADFPQELREILQKHATVLDPEIRMVCGAYKYYSSAEFHAVDLEFF